MTEYVIVAKLDPSGVAAGTSQVKQSLGQIDSAAATTATNLGKVAATGSAGSRTLADSATKAATGQDNMNAATLRVLQAVDREAAELAKLNTLVAEAKRLFDAGKISTEQYAAAQKLAADAAMGHNTNINQQRQGVLILSEQFRQFSTQVTTGTSPVQAFGQQAGQAAFAMQFLGGKAGEVGKFLAGGWGTLIIVAVSLLSELAGAAIESSDKIGKMVEEMKKDERQAEDSIKANKLFAESIEGITKAKRDADTANQKWRDGLRGDAYEALLTANKNLENAKSIREVTKAKLEAARADLAIKEKYAGGMSRDPESQAQFLAQQTGKAGELQGMLNSQNAEIASLSARAVETQIDLADSIAKAYADPVQKIREMWEGPKGLITLKKLDAEFNKKSIADQTKILLLMHQQEDAAIKKAKADERKPPSDGVDRFRSREQAIGIAGRELQKDSLRVGENEQFGGVHGQHLEKDHGKYAIDVNSGTGVTEADVPDLKAKFDALARRYQARGYKVLWNGQIYSPYGNGPNGPIKGANKHRDHMHIEAPTAIVGKPTNESTEEQAQREEKEARTKAEQQSDFVQGIIDSASVRGLPKGVQTLKAQIDKSLAEYKRRFNEAAGPDATAKITGALTDADARETAERFREAYVYPLNDLIALEGKTGLARKIAAAQLAERTKLGRDLNAVEAIGIAVGVKRIDEEEREAQILESLKQPMEDYMSNVAALNALLAKGQINQTGYNAALANLQSPARSLLTDMPNNPFAAGKNDFNTLGQKADEDARFAEEQKKTADNREALLKLNIDYDALVEAQAQRHADNMNKIDQARQEMQLSAGESIAASLASIAADTLGKQSGVYKALFAVEKGFTIAKASLALYQAVSQALATPFPANIPLIAQAFAEGATIIQAIKGVNFADGGLVNGQGGPRSDSVQANLSRGEYVVNAAAAARNMALLEAINSGRVMSGTRAMTSDHSAAGRPAGGGRVTVIQHPGIEIEERENLTTGDVEIIAKRAVQKHAPGVISADIARPNSPTSKAIRTHTTAGTRKV